LDLYLDSLDRLAPAVLYAVGFAASLFLVRLTIPLARRAGLVSRGGTVAGEQPVPLGGGIAVTGVILAAGFLLSWLELLPVRVPLGVLPAFFLGLADDILEFPAGPKVLLQALSVVPYLVLAPFPGWAVLPAMLFLAVAQNAWNFLDVMDGLLGWVGTVCLLGAGAIFLVAGPAHGGQALLALAAAGALNAFLVWNSHPAGIYLGDAGSLALGMLSGILVLEGTVTDLSLLPPLVLAGALPFFDLVFVLAGRRRLGIPIFRNTPGGFAHSLLTAGRSVPRIVSSARRAALALAAAGCLLAVLRDRPAAVVLAGLVAAWAGFAAWRHLRALQPDGRATEESRESD
jgi:UDP-N-acetylmuramyl pentapeptide phosphotransferase/UDP-N-acetylglucosamine-1-phosphate transferase